MTSNRSLKPYPPPGVSVTPGGSDVTISWYNRNRLISAIRKQTDPTETPETGQTTTVTIYGHNDTVIHTETGLTGTSFVYTNAAETSDAGALQARLTVRAKAVRDGYESAEQVVRYDRADFVFVGAVAVQVGSNDVYE